MLLLLVLLLQPSTAPVVQDGWIRPDGTPNAQPIWGVADGIRVGLWPTGGGPRGLVRVWAPYLKNPPGQVINFIAVEPIVGNKRGLSELEHSALDSAPGKRMWTSDEFPLDPTPSQTPARGKIIDIDGTRALSFFIVVEPFVNGARPVVQVILRHDRRREVTFRVFAMEGSPPMQACVLTATMGNYARLRRLQLKDTVVEATGLWPDFKSKEPWGRGFAPAKSWGVKDLPVRRGRVQVEATPNEPDPAQANYAPGTPEWWQYRGLAATQIWRCPAAEDVSVRVNGRYVYWGSDKPIPGGVAFENFELHAPFQAGQEFTFGVEPVQVAR